MRTSTKNRFWRLILCAALALMFWLFDLTTLAWVFASLVLGPMILGGIIWGFSSLGPPSLRPDKND